MIPFDEFFAHVHGHDPYPWQRLLAERCAAGMPPAVIAAPTGAGKTAAVDALVWALAAQAERPAHERTVGVRLVWAIDRRILVDEVHRHARRLAASLEEAVTAPDHPLHPLAVALSRLAGDGNPPLVATRWRGGIDPDGALLSPLQPQVITSTVGQIASRLLFRGYGIGTGSRSLAAGLAGADTTICLDEAHLAEPFRETVEAVAHQREEATESPALPRLRTITITATPATDVDATDVVGLSAEDRAHPALSRRLHGVKQAVLVDDDRPQETRLADETIAHLDNGAQTVACVVNTVRRALQVHRLLSERVDSDETIVCEPLIGPQRPVDRRELFAGAGARLFDRSVDGPRVVCVATQTFEVGLDADVDALVTESASASALVQRLGRLNRSGAITGRATVVRDTSTWLYADDEPCAWEWLRGLERDREVDVSVAALDALRPFPRVSEPIGAPVLTAETVHALAHTSAAFALGPRQEVDVEVFWRGAESQPGADVGICWRGDLRPDVGGSEGQHYRELLLTHVPPQRQELLPLSVRAARALIAALHPLGSPASAAKAALADADVEGEEPPGSVPAHAQSADVVPFLVVRGDRALSGSLDPDVDDAVHPHEIRAGDVLVLPAGRRLEGFPADDRAGDLSPQAAGGELPAAPDPLRLNRETLDATLGTRPLSVKAWDKIDAACAAVHARLERAHLPEPARAALLEGLVGRLTGILPEHPGLAAFSPERLSSADAELRLHELGFAGRDGVPRYDPGDDDLDVGEESHVNGEGEDDDDVEQSTEEVDRSDEPRPLERTWVLTAVPRARRDLADRAVGNGTPPSLAAHSESVRREVVRYAMALDLAPELRGALEVAALAHDLGKADPRRQAFFRCGVHAVGALPLAKSEFGGDDRRTARIAAELAGLPHGLRHEIASVAVLADALASGRYALPAGVDPDLVLHLIGAHHGRGNPIPPVPRGGDPARLFDVHIAGIAGTAWGDGDDGWDRGAWLRRAATVRRRYGTWQVSYLEALLMLADRVVSARGE